MLVQILLLHFFGFQDLKENPFADARRLNVYSTSFSLHLICTPSHEEYKDPSLGKNE